MNNITIADGVIRLSANAAPNSLLFESMWPIPHGVSMNSYLVQGARSAIIDGLCGWDGVPETLFKLLDDTNTDLNSIDYVIINHMEPDHSGWLDAFKKIRADFRIVASKKAQPILKEYYGITDNIHIVEDGDSIDLGNGRILTFHYIPNVHWPETMATFDTLSGTLFPCDLFGAFGSVDADAPFDDQQTDKTIELFDREMLRYFANILGAFSYSVDKALAKIKPLPIQCVAPGHGLIWRDNPAAPVDHYARLASYSNGPATDKVTLIWSSMYGATELAVQPLVDALRGAGVSVVTHKVPETHISYILQSVWESSGVAIGMPTYEYKMFPAMHAALDEIFKKKALNRRAFRFGSYGWSGGAQKELDALVESSKCKWEFIEPVEFIGRPKPDDINKIVARGTELAAQVKRWTSSCENA